MNSSSYNDACDELFKLADEIFKISDEIKAHKDKDFSDLSIDELINARKTCKEFRYILLKKSLQLDRLWQKFEDKEEEMSKS